MIERPVVYKTLLDRLLPLITDRGPGAYLPPSDQLAKELGVSRTALREAVAVLIYLNVLAPKPKLGTKILPESSWLLDNKTLLNRLLPKDFQL